MLQAVRLCLIALFVMAADRCGAQAEDGTQAESAPLIGAFDLMDGTTRVPGLGRAVPGIDLLDGNAVRWWVGDDPAFAQRDFADTSWVDADSAMGNGRVHWLRVVRRFDPGLRDAPLVLSVACAADIELFLNGTPLVRADDRAAQLYVRSGINDGHPPRMVFPIAFAGDGREETIAVRMDLGAGASGARPAIHLSLHTTGIDAVTHRDMLHAGLYIGINCIIFLLAIILWSFDRADKNWALLAAITFITAFVAYSGTVGAMDMGIGLRVRAVLLSIGMALYFVPSFLLIVLLRRLLGMPRWKRMKWYIAGFVFLAMVSMVIGYAEADTLEWEISSRNTAPLGLVLFAIGAVIAAVVIIGVMVQVVRLGLKLLRSHGYVRLIGAGALFSSLSRIVLDTVNSAVGLPEESWLTTVSNYCSFVGLPVTAAVFLAIRSARHSKEVARQRDDLDLEVHERTAELRKERDRSNELLLNILPHEVAEELKAKGAAEARHFDQATVMFTDFKGFTTMSEKVDPGLLLAELNACFKAFDDIIGARGIEKIKTIGDAYMCAGGLPDPKTSSPADVVFAALEMQDFMERRRVERETDGKLAFVMRVGIHTGPVVAGIVGVKKFQYDIWGDTVNTAARMESSGEVGRVNISGSTWAAVKDVPGLVFTPRGKVQAKGKGEMEMWYVERS